MRFRGHESFYLRQGWITKGLKNIVSNPEMFYIDKKEQTDILGIGSNMVKSLRFWLESFNLIELKKHGKKRYHALTKFGEIIWEYDRYIQEDVTLWLLHYFLVINKEKATSWYWLFNEYKISDFTQDDFIVNIQSYIKANDGPDVAKRSLEEDFKCLVKLYSSTINEDEYESNMYSPLSALRILEDNKKKYEFNKGKANIDDLVAFFIMLDQYYKSDYVNDADEFNIERLYKDRENVGKILRFNWNIINEYLDVLQKSEYISVTRTSGLDVIQLTQRFDQYNLLKSHYAKLEKE